MIFNRGDLTSPEQEVWDAIATGEVVRLQAEDRERNNPATGSTWGRERSIRGQLLADLLAEGRNSSAAPAQFLWLQGARIVGGLYLESMTLRCPVTLQYCYFDEEVVLNEAHVISLRLHGCHLPGLAAERIETRHNLELSRGFTAKGEVNVLGALVRGRMELNRATLQNPGGPALRAEGLAVDQDLFCEDLQADGEIRLEGARIGGTLNFNAARLHNPGGRALTADGITVGQPPVLRQRLPGRRRSPIGWCAHQRRA